MKKDIHPAEYREIVFKDMTNGDMYLSKSCAATSETIEFEGKEYPLFKLDISMSSHPYFTGKMNMVDTAGRIDKFKNRYAKHSK
ncbi:MAG: type B 50S ribosomal protein L31 [Flavobacteriales bacterium]